VEPAVRAIPTDGSFADDVVLPVGGSKRPPSDGYYLDEFGHVQSVDQALALERGVEMDRLEADDLVCLLAAGTGYTWSATVLRWRD